MENVYKKMSDDELLYIYKDIVTSDDIPQRAESLVPYAEQVKKNIGGDFTLREAIAWSRKDYFEEIARRYFLLYCGTKK